MKEKCSRFFLVCNFLVVVVIQTTRLVVDEFHYTNDLAK
jgi:hypothetical protein